MARLKQGKQPFVIGLVGGVASGKSYVAQVFEDLGAVKIDADVLGHEVLKRPLIARRLRQVFGEQILLDDGSVDRRKLGTLVFGTQPQAHAARKQLEEIVHPLIHAAAVQELRKFKESTAPPLAVVIDAPLLLEAGWAPLCDAILFIDTPVEVRRRRAVERGWTEQDFGSREAAQLSLQEKRVQATHIVPGDGTAEELRRTLRKLIDEIAEAD